MRYEDGKGTTGDGMVWWGEMGKRSKGENPTNTRKVSKTKR